MRNFLDLHCHWVAGIDDGAKTVRESVELLRALRRAGFDTVCATPHMRPGMFDNSADDLRAAFERTCRAIEGEAGLPKLMLSSEHFFDDVVFGRIVGGSALPYPGGKAVLIEFPTSLFPARIAHSFADLKRRGIRPVLAHPERYEPVWRTIDVLEPLLDCGTVLLLDVAALAGKYGKRPQKAAEELLDAGFYYAACSDAHKPWDVADVERGIDRLHALEGADEARFMLSEGPKTLLEGRVEA